jgi:hypothetical protein
MIKVIVNKIDYPGIGKCIKFAKQHRIIGNNNKHVLRCNAIIQMVLQNKKG